MGLISRLEFPMVHREETLRSAALCALFSFADGSVTGEILLEKKQYHVAQPTSPPMAPHLQRLLQGLCEMPQLLLLLLHSLEASCSQF